MAEATALEIEQYHLSPLLKDAIGDTFSEFVADFQGARNEEENIFLNENSQLYNLLIQGVESSPRYKERYWDGILMMHRIFRKQEEITGTKTPSIPLNKAESYFSDNPWNLEDASSFPSDYDWRKAQEVIKKDDLLRTHLGKMKIDLLQREEPDGNKMSTEERSKKREEDINKRKAFDMGIADYYSLVETALKKQPPQPFSPAPGTPPQT